ncbi:hypothetical protein [Proteus mirabilis]|uniref:hypothetical protein n=1 Tax=Proteus mirabilis TaxID=584 RepID=UPI001B38F566|nr:hypothetical protein [Proteus mirabilis]MBQ0618707.1 hypothetical protein [Proteus mirabilis]MDM3706081.1 hypothetical protein [Proteus mirabilis]MDM3721944.1 hypothetical protein [Proteus mirabilis]HCT1988700.1 hypothetical protein [Proteus mirabilis]HCT9438727.1 hypothetical protein [Proteus mirabilis]
MENCFSYQVYKEDIKFYYIKVRESHNPERCEGDTNVSIALFNFKLSKTNNQLYKEDGLGINGYQPINDKSQYIHGTYSYEYTGEKLNDGTAVLICWVFNFIDNRTVNLSITSWYDLFRCDGNYDVQQNKNEIILIYNKNNEYEYDKYLPQFTIKRANGQYFVKKSIILQ